MNTPMTEAPPVPPQKIDTSTLLERQAEYEQVKADHIKSLLQDRADSIANHEKHIDQIDKDLKALGYTKPRAPRKKKESK